MCHCNSTAQIHVDAGLSILSNSFSIANTNYSREKDKWCDVEMTGASLLLPLIRVGVERMATSDVEQPNLCCRKHILQCAQDITSSQCSVRPCLLAAYSQNDESWSSSVTAVTADHFSSTFDLEEIAEITRTRMQESRRFSDDQISTTCTCGDGISVLRCRKDYRGRVALHRYSLKCRIANLFIKVEYFSLHRMLTLRLHIVRFFYILTVWQQ